MWHNLSQRERVSGCDKCCRQVCTLQEVRQIDPQAVQLCGLADNSKLRTLPVSYDVHVGRPTIRAVQGNRLQWLSNRDLMFLFFSGRFRHGSFANSLSCPELPKPFLEMLDVAVMTGQREKIGRLPMNTVTGGALDALSMEGLEQHLHLESTRVDLVDTIDAFLEMMRSPYNMNVSNTVTVRRSAQRPASLLDTPPIRLL